MNARALMMVLATQYIDPAGGRIPSRPRRRLRRRAVGAFVLVAAVLALWVPGALASGFTLGLSAPSPGVAGQPMVLQASGTIPVDDIPYPYWFSLDALPASVVSTCPADASEGAQLALHAGGQIVVLTQREIPDAAGNFSLPVGFTPWAPGTYLMCAYTDDGGAVTLAAAALSLDVHDARPLNLSKPRVRRGAGRLVCRPGRWAGRPTAYRYRWSVDGRPAKRGRTVAVKRLRGRTVRCSVTASNAAGAVTAVSRPFSA
jgi:hypothetical protein